jgi:hypothetical protein
VWELLWRLLLEHHDEADDTEAQVAFAYWWGGGVPA